MVIVTGGAGFIGSNIVKGLNDIGISNIIIVDNLDNPAKHLNLNRLKFIDYIDKRDFDISAFLKNEKVDTIFHNGACSDTTATDGRYIMLNNYEYSKKLLNVSIDKNIRLIYASSASVYGNGDNGFKERAECEYPLNIYAYSKFLFDRYYLSISDKIKSQVVGLRYFNVYGEQECHKGKMASVAYHLFNQIKNGDKMKLFTGSENFKRDFIYVLDIVSVNLFFYNNPTLSGIYNLGTGKAESFCEIAKALQELYPQSQIEYVDFPENLKGKYQKFTESDMSKLLKVGYDKKFITVNEGTKMYAKNLQKSNGYIL